jgi:DNA-binding CsgD family transcriptional regulator
MPGHTHARGPSAAAAAPENLDSHEPAVPVGQMITETTPVGGHAATGARTRAEPRLVLVDEPQRLIREALVAAIDAAWGLSAIDASDARSAAIARADAVVVSAGALRFGWHGLLDSARSEGRPSPIVIVADHGPVTPSIDGGGQVVVSRQTPLSIIVACLRLDGADPREMPRWNDPSPSSEPALTARERQVLGLLASGLSPAEVARGLAITTYTARDHIKAIRAKLDRPTTMAAVLEAIRRGLLRVDGV